MKREVGTRKGDIIDPRGIASTFMYHCQLLVGILSAYHSYF